MRSFIQFIFIFLFYLSCRSQVTRFEILGGNSSMINREGISNAIPLSNIVTCEKLSEAKLMSDIIPDYPTAYYNSLIDYVNIEIITTQNGKQIIAANLIDSLTLEQKNNLNYADMSSTIGIKIHFKYKDPANDVVGSARKIKEMNFGITLVPAKEAEFEGGLEQMNSFVKENVISKIPLNNNSAKIPNVSVVFTVNELGKAIDARILKSSSDPKIDQLMIDAVNKMPQWKPAENAKGEKIKQEFSFGIPNVPRGC